MKHKHLNFITLEMHFILLFALKVIQLFDVKSVDSIDQFDLITKFIQNIITCLR